MTIRAVIFDFGGVVTSSPFEAFNRMEAERGLPRDFVRRVNAADPDGNAWARFERAEIDAATFDRLFAAEARALGHELPGSDVLALLAGDHEWGWTLLVPGLLLFFGVGVYRTLTATAMTDVQ